ncbi:MAG: TetR/AcrR family transcriptional regulator [Bacteroidales bacterium]|nr:TetR/AcrR family transcriptional regulator [Bacteroidales bacterium]
MKRLPTEIRKEQIKEAVLEIIYQDGISKFTTKRLAEKIGISEAGIFRHYASKKDIFFDILKDVDNQLLSPMKEIEKEDIPTTARLKRIVCRTIHYIIKNKGVSVLMLSEIAENNHPEFKCKVHAIFSGQRKIVERIVKKGIEKGELNEKTDAHAFHCFTWASLLGFILNYCLIKQAFSKKAFVSVWSNIFTKLYPER